MTTPLHEKLHFDTANGQVLEQSRRYLLMRTDVLMGLFDNLPQETRDQALCALGQSVERFGSDSVRAYAAQLGVDKSALLSTMQDAAASLGWGCWQFEPTPDGLRLTVRNSPFAAGTAQRGHPACHAITGMFTGLTSILYPAGAKVLELSCVAQTGNGHCSFEAVPA